MTSTLEDLDLLLDSAARANLSPTIPRDLPPGRDLVVRTSRVAAWSGYGAVVVEVARGLLATGVGLEVVSPRVDPEGIPPEVLERARRRPSSSLRWSLSIQTPRAILSTITPTVALTMWESDRLPPEAVVFLRRATSVVVPCGHNLEAFLASGVDRPIDVVPLGVDLEAFRPPAGPAAVRGSTLRVGAAGRLEGGGTRKGLDDVLEAFRRAFPRGNEDVVLEVRGHPDKPAPEIDDPRVRTSNRRTTRGELAAWYGSLDLFLSLSRGEGFGLQPLEAMACGTPVALVPWSGHVEYFSPLSGFAIGYRLEEASGGVYGGHGARWAVPDLDEAADVLRLAREDLDGLRGMRLAARRTAEAFPWSRTVRGILDVLVRRGALEGPRDCLRGAHPVNTKQS